MKIRWAVKLYRDWREMRLNRVDFKEAILNADLDKIKTVSKDDLEFALCRFICEVKKSKEDADFPGRTLYQIICCIQNLEVGSLFIGRIL